MPIAISRSCHDAKRRVVIEDDPTGGRASGIGRRAFVKAGVGAGALLLGAGGIDPRPAAAGTPASLRDIDHVVFLIQENRSFDHYFGTLSGVRGFSDPDVLQRPWGTTVFAQPDPDLGRNPSGRVLPFRLGSRSGGCVPDLNHSWAAQHLSWAGGRMEGFVRAHRIIDDAPFPPGAPPANLAPLTMGYFKREDIPFHHALADAFTVCDGYFSSVLGPTYPNRVMSMSGTVDPEGRLGGGPVLDNSAGNGLLQWESYPERLQSHGIDWRVYQERNNDSDNVLPLFYGFQNTSSDLYRRGNSVIATAEGGAGPGLAARLKHDVTTGNLPQVSWIIASDGACEHPPATPAAGARFVAGILDALTADPRVWARTALFYTFDENDGFFDHVPPPVAPPGTRGEYVSDRVAAGNGSATRGLGGPVGLGFRVPMIVISPLARGGLVCGDVFDHTSLLLFLERRFGVEVPHLSAWRRSVVGDLTAAFNFAAGPDLSLPSLPAVSAPAVAGGDACGAPAAGVLLAQTLPVQEPGPRRPRPSGLSEAVAARAPNAAGRAVAGPPGGMAPAVLAAGAAAVGAAAWWRWKRFRATAASQRTISNHEASPQPAEGSSFQDHGGADDE